MSINSPLSSLPSSVLTTLIHVFGFDDARFSPSDWSFERNPFWTTYLLTIVVYPCLFYLTWYINPSMSRNKLGLSWVLGFYSATLFTIAGIYEVRHLRTIFNAAVDLPPTTTITTATNIVATTFPISTEVLDLTTTAAKDICYPILKTGVLALVATLPSFMRLDPGSSLKYYCFSDLSWPRRGSDHNSTWSEDFDFSAASSPSTSTTTESFHRNTKDGAINHDHRDPHQSSKQGPLSLRHRVFQSQMQRPHLFFSLENYPDDGRIGPHIVAANFQAFLLVDLILGFIYYRKQLEPFSTVVHHIIYYFIVIHMRAGDMLSVFCICGTPIEASSIWLAFGRMFPHRRTPMIERLYLVCFVSTRLIYVGLLWHEIFFNYPDKSVAFLYTITISLHVYWFVLYLKTQKRFKAKQRSQQLQQVLQSLANTAKTAYVGNDNKDDCLMMAKSKMNDYSSRNSHEHFKQQRRRFESDRFDATENRVSIELSEREYHPSPLTRDPFPRGGAQIV
ncbi:hypothetical protein BGZ65_009684 [Modicella reniformis]|uniref:TLC domain-containing protein n=1 Tax=Modicella reniformis TaxID=1440133 RepID=A0A9P6MKC4_9FUNG|nr:hypothetical protein BGZ65_009684 [Modicella reniformis]